jgi:hypothetical protein
MKLRLAPERHTSGRVYPTAVEVERAAEAIATIMHATLCRYDHTEGCPWEIYDKGWSAGAHADWKRRAMHALEHAYDV